MTEREGGRERERERETCFFFMPLLRLLETHNTHTHTHRQCKEYLTEKSIKPGKSKHTYTHNLLGSV